VIEADVTAEGVRLLERASASGVLVRVLGGVAVALHAEGGLAPPFVRTYRDLDLVVRRGGRRDAGRLLQDAGYEPHVPFNALHGNERLLFFDRQHDRQVDVFVGSLRMCHEIPLEGRLELERQTVPLAELLLTKLQIVELNEKDVTDAAAILHGHEVGSDDDDRVNGARVAELCAADWGLWRTITANLREVRARVVLPDEEAERVRGRLDNLLARIEAEPKSRGWRLRARIGERKRWYELPEEVGGEP
jgi:hypothetical protein